MTRDPERNRTRTCDCGRAKTPKHDRCDGCRVGRPKRIVPTTCIECAEPRRAEKNRCREHYNAYRRRCEAARKQAAGYPVRVAKPKPKPTAEQRVTLRPRKNGLPSASGGSWWAERLSWEEFSMRANTLDPSRGKPPTALMPMNWPMASGR